MASEEINAIAENFEALDFENTIAVHNKVGEKLGNVESVLFNLKSNETFEDL